MSIRKRFDIPVIFALALREEQILQNYPSIIAAHT